MPAGSTCREELGQRELRWASCDLQPCSVMQVDASWT